MLQGKIIIAGLGPGSQKDITPAVAEAIAGADIVIGYKFYFQFIRHLLTGGTQCLDTGMRQEEERAAAAIDQAMKGKTVCIISS